MAKTGLLKKEKKKKEKKKKIPQRRGGPRRESYWSWNDEVWEFFKTGLSHIHPGGCGLTVLISESSSVMFDSATPWTIQSRAFSRPEY